MKHKRIVLGLMFISVLTVNAQKVKWVSTTDSARWQTHPAIKLKKADGEINDSTVLIDISQKAQQITGMESLAGIGRERQGSRAKSFV